MTYWVVFHVTGKCEIKVAADSPMEAIKEANHIAGEEDFGALENIDWYYHHVEDEHGNRVCDEECL